ncbi:MAG TPA: hypothetical protein VF070_13465 [Streptosporangiaceae bacterium]
MNLRNSALFAGVAAAALAGGAGTAYAVTHSGTPAVAQTTSQSADSPSSSPSPSPSTSPSTTPGHHRFGGLGIGGIGGAVHGQLTVPKSGGGYQTVDVQRGTVTSVSSTSITVKSADGYTATYAVTGSTEVNAESAGIGAVKTNDSVFVTATVSGGSATASSVTDITSIGASRGSFGFPAQPAKPDAAGW